MSKLMKCSTYSNTLKIKVIEQGKVPLSSKSLEHKYFNLIHSSTDFSFVFIQAIKIEKLTSRFYKIVSQNRSVFKYIESERNKGKSCVKCIYFYKIKFTKYMKFTKFTIYRLKTMKFSIYKANKVFKVRLTCR